MFDWIRRAWLYKHDEHEYAYVELYYCEWGAGSLLEGTKWVRHGKQQAKECVRCRHQSILTPIEWGEWRQTGAH